MDTREGLTLQELFQRFPDNAAAAAWFVEGRWPAGVTCPRCDSDNVQHGAKHPAMPYRCRGCGKRFSVKTGTAMEGSNLGYQTWAIAIYQLTTSLKGVSSMKLHRDLGITQKSAWHLAHRIRTAMEESGSLFGGPVEVDEAFVGGKARNMHARDRQRSHSNKTIVVGVKDRPTHQVQASAVPSADWRTLSRYVQDRIRPGTSVYSDENAAYRAVVPRHAAVRHSSGEYVRGDVHTNGIESFWSMLKRGFVGTYHVWSPKHVNRYVQEFAGRNNIRPLSTSDQMSQVALGMVGKRLRYRDLIA